MTPYRSARDVHRDQLWELESLSWLYLTGSPAHVLLKCSCFNPGNALENTESSLDRPHCLHCDVFQTFVALSFELGETGWRVCNSCGRILQSFLYKCFKLQTEEHIKAGMLMQHRLIMFKYTWYMLCANAFAEEHWSRKEGLKESNSQVPPELSLTFCCKCISYSTGSATGIVAWLLNQASTGHWTDASCHGSMRWTPIHHCRFTFLANCEGVWPKKGRFIDRDTFCLRARFAAHSSKRIAECELCEWCFGFLSRYTCSIISHFAAASVKVWLCVIIDAVVRLCVLSTVRKEQILLRKTGMDKIVYRYGLHLFTLFKFTRITRTPYNN